MLLPCYRPPHKSGLHSTAAQRLDMLRAAVEDVNAVGKRRLLSVDEREMLGSGPSYTIDTVKELRIEVGPQACLVFVIGWDSLQSLDTWHQWEQLFSFAHFLIVPRPGYRLIQSRRVKKCFDKRLVSIDKLKTMSFGGVCVLDVPEIDLSSTGIRESIKKGNLSLCEIPESVKKLIERDKLYT